MGPVDAPVAPRERRISFAEFPQRVWWRKALFQIHLWVGVFIGLYVVAISLSGSLLVFEQNLLDDVPMVPHASQAGSLSWGQIARAAEAAWPGSSLSFIDMRTARRRVVSVSLRQNGQERLVYIDSFSGRVLGEEIPQRRHWLVEWAESFHNQLAAGAEGATANGVGGALLFVMSVTGIVLWWPGRKGWTRALKVKWNARWARLNWDLHSAFGFWCLFFISMWGLSGAYFIFPQPFQRVISIFSPMTHLRDLPSDWQPGQPVLPVDTLVGRAMALYPRDQLAYLYMDVNRPHGVVKVFLSPQPSAPLTFVEDVVTYQPATGAVLSNISSAAWTRGERLAMGIYAVHFGTFAGLPGQILFAAIGLAPLLLAVTGYLMWWKRVLKKKWAALR
ncbi:MAG: PepSY-associated TM helix domain-containing protein [Acidobacteriaceae bacterium]